MSNWVLLRGLTRESRHWGDFIDAFKTRMPGAQVIALDFPGNGRLHRERSVTSVPAMMECCRDELRRRQLTAPFTLLAISLGGMVATEWAARYPNEIDACVLINTSMRPFSSFKQRLRLRHYFTLLKLLVAPLDDKQMEMEVLQMTTNHESSRQQLANWVQYRREHPVSRSNALRQLLAAGRYTAPAAKPICPLLILASTQDGMVDAECSRQVAKAWNATIIEHPTAGHDLTVDDGEWVANQIAHWRRTAS